MTRRPSYVLGTFAAACLVAVAVLVALAAVALALKLLLWAVAL